VSEDHRVAVIGLGYVGLPLAISFVEAGLQVEGIDLFAGRVTELNAGSSPIDDVSDARLQAALAGGLTVVAPADASIGEADAIFVCVPTPITTTKDPDLAPVLSAAETIRDHVRAGQLVILQSTTFPGTTTGPFREVVEASGLKAGVDFDLAFAPERVNPGDPASASKGVPRLVGATTPEATRRAAALLRCINDQVVELSSPDAAELAKLLENVFRNVNIAFVNQLALLCERMGLDVWEVINAAATKPFGFMKFTPGPGVGGHCIPVDPYYLAWRAREFDFIDRFIELAGDINFAMPRHVVDLVAEALNDRGRALKGAKVGILGVAFKPNVRDARNSPAADVLALIAARGADVRFHDPHVPTFKDNAGQVRNDTPLPELLGWADVIVVVTAHSAIDWASVYRDADLVVDTAPERPLRARGHDGGCDVVHGDGLRRVDDRGKRPAPSPGPDDRPQPLRGGPARPPRGRVARGQRATRRRPRSAGHGSAG
jgi:UDP-N-acetyl-D-glucosamine dehydrogenase